MAIQSKMRTIPKQSSFNFIEQCLQGMALPEDIDDHIDQWHEGGTGVPLYAFLGMTQHEYTAWVMDDAILPYIITAHKDRLPFGEVMQHEYTAEFALARSQGGDKVSRLMQWLKNEGLLS